MGILFAIGAIVCWGLGDFLIERSTRKFGDWIALFYITAFASIALLPFVYKDLQGLLINNFYLLILLGSSLVLLFAALLDFEALKTGKISVIEPIFALEVPITAALAFWVIKEHLNIFQILLIFTLMTGILLVSIRSFHNFKKMTWEKGVAYAILATLAMGIVNFLFGIGARTISPLMINWFTSMFAAIVCLVYLTVNGQLKLIAKDFKNNPQLIMGVSVLDNFAWIAYSYSTLYIPIAIAISLTESYIALAAILGLVINREHLKKHQLVGLIITVISAIILAGLTS